MNSTNKESGNSRNSPLENDIESRTAYGGSAWQVSEENVTIFCGPQDFDRIVWPRFAAEKATRSRL